MILPVTSQEQQSFFQQLLTTRFRLSSVQVSIADLCRKENGRLLPEPISGCATAFCQNVLPITIVAFPRILHQ